MVELNDVKFYNTLIYRWNKVLRNIKLPFDTVRQNGERSKS